MFPAVESYQGFSIAVNYCTGTQSPSAGSNLGRRTCGLLFPFRSRWATGGQLCLEGPCLAGAARDFTRRIPGRRVSDSYPQEAADGLCREFFSREAT